MPYRPPSDIWFCDIFYFDCRKYPCLLFFFFQSRLKCKRIHDGCQHADVIANGPLKAVFFCGCSAKDIAAADNYGNLNVVLMSFFNFLCKPLGKFGVNAVLPFSKKRFTGEFEKDS